MQKSNLSRSKQGTRRMSSKPVTSLQREITDQINKGNRLMMQEKYEEAAVVYAKVLERNPTDSVALSNLGGSLVKLGRIHEAKVILEYALELAPKDIHARINLGGVLQAEKDFKGALNNALDAVTIDPTSPLAFNNLGCAFGSINMMSEALHAYETALQLAPDNIEAALNVAMTLAETGNHKESLTAYENLLNRIPKNNRSFTETVKFYASFLYLQFGDLKKGWDHYESGLSPLVPTGAARSPRRNFNFPQWQGEDLTGKKLLIWREQGIGDELLFSSCLIDLDALNADITFECSERLVETYARSFPKFKIQPEMFNIIDGSNIRQESFDYHVPLGSTLKILRSKISDFDRQRPFIKVNAAQAEEFKRRLKPYSGKKLIGICWRSGNLDPLRNREYTALQDWGEILSLPDYAFINLQYGDCESEIQEVESNQKIKIIRWPDLNLKNDLDKVFSLMSCLDCVISAPTAVGSMAGALGLPTLLLGAQQTWVTLGATKGKYPWYPNTYVCPQQPGSTIATVLLEVPNILKVYLTQDPELQ